MAWNTKIPHLRRFVLQNFPFIEEDFDALTDYQLLCKVVEYLNTVITSQNEVIQQMINVTADFESLEGLFNQLKDYVDNYFDNLDVQDEINNKLEAMVEDGTLQEIITTYIQSNVAWTFDNVSEMQSATNLIADSYAQTYGYYSVGDGGSAKYKIREAEEEETADGMFTIAVADGLIAELVINDMVNVCQLGAYGDGTHDDTSVLSAAITYCLTNDKILTAPSGKTFIINSALNVNNAKIDLNTSTIKAGSAIDMIVIDSENYHGYIKNVTLDMDSTATTGIKITEGRKKEIYNVVINNVTTLTVATK